MSHNITAADAWAHLDSLAKPRRSLGRLEEIAVMLASRQGTLTPKTSPRRIVLFAGDHGVVASGVSAWPSEVTGLMVGTIAAGKAASSAMAAVNNVDLRLVDVGVAGPALADPPAFFRDARVANGTANLSVESAMTVAQFEAAWAVGADEARRAQSDGHVLVMVGEMGIGNTTPAACITMLLADVPIDSAIGRGAGADDQTLARKRTVVSVAVARAKSLEGDICQIASVCGFEIAAMAGFYAEAAQSGLVILLDGFVTTAAALIANRLVPGSANAMIAAHRSAEPGHDGALAALDRVPLLDWDMRLGEGTGALIAVPMLDAAAALMRDVAVLEAVGVDRKD